MGRAASRAHAFAARIGVTTSIWQAPMAGAQGAALAIAVARGGGLGALPSALFTVDALRAEVAAFRAATPAPLNMNFFCHAAPVVDDAREAAWRARLAPLYAELRVEAPTGAAPARAPFDGALCGVVEDVKPEVVSFHLGLPSEALLARVKATGAFVVSSATTVAEGKALAARGVDAIIAQGFEAGGHRGTFLDVTHAALAMQIGTFALVPQLVDAVDVPIIAAGGIGDGRGIAAALMLGASAVQLGTAYLACPEATVSDVHRRALDAARAQPASFETALTNVFTGRPARGIVNRAMRALGPLSTDAPAFPLAGGALTTLRARTEATGDFAPQWAGQAAPLSVAMPAEALTRMLAAAADEHLATA
jgi:nitronate monooxygenase